METLTREEIEMCEIAVGIVTDTRTMTDDNMAKWDLLWDKLERMQKEAAEQSMHQTGLTPRQKEEVEQIVMRALSTGSV